MVSVRSSSSRCWPSVGADVPGSERGSEVGFCSG